MGSFDSIPEQDFTPEPPYGHQFDPALARLEAMPSVPLPSGNYFGPEDTEPEFVRPDFLPTDGRRGDASSVPEHPHPKYAPEASREALQPPASPYRRPPSRVAMRAAAAAVLVAGTGAAWYAYSGPPDARNFPADSTRQLPTEDPRDRIVQPKTLSRLRDTVEQDFYADTIYTNGVGCLDGTPYPESNVVIDLDLINQKHSITIVPADDKLPDLRLTTNPGFFEDSITPADTYTADYLKQHDC